MGKQQKSSCRPGLGLKHPPPLPRLLQTHTHTPTHTFDAVNQDQGPAASGEHPCLYRGVSSFRVLVSSLAPSLPLLLLSYSSSSSACSRTTESLGTEGCNEVAAPLGWPGTARTGREMASQRLSVRLSVRPRFVIGRHPSFHL